MKKRTFISFDYDIKECLVGQARNPDSPFEITDMSIKEPVSSNWKENARRRIRGCDVVVVLCGEHTDTASGATAELTIAQEEGIPYFLLRGRGGGKKELQDNSLLKFYPHVAFLFLLMLPYCI